MSDVLQRPIELNATGAVSASTMPAVTAAFHALQNGAGLLAAMPGAIGRAFMMAYLAPFAECGTRRSGDSPEDY